VTSYDVLRAAKGPYGRRRGNVEYDLTDIYECGLPGLPGDVK